jgi:hypothetical protein
MEDCLGKMEATNLEANLVETFGALKKQYGDRYLDVGHRQKPKKRTQGNGRSQKKLTIICR